SHAGSRQEYCNLELASLAGQITFTGYRTDSLGKLVIDLFHIVLDSREHQRIYTYHSMVEPTQWAEVGGAREALAMHSGRHPRYYLVRVVVVRKAAPDRGRRSGHRQAPCAVLDSVDRFRHYDP